MLDIRETPQYQEYSIFRHDYFHKLLAWKDKRVIKVITGVRRCGKSMVMTELCKELSKSIPYTNITFLNFEMLENEELQEYHALYTALKSRIQPSSMNYILLDEIQLVPQFEKAVDSLFLLPNVDIYLTGSNANMLSSEIATLLSGRYVEIHIQPFSFQEFQLGYEKRFPNNNLDKESLYTKFITYGGFPYLHNIYEQQENMEALKIGIGNLIRHIDIIKNVYKLPLVVTLNKYITDSKNEVEFVIKTLDNMKVSYAINDAWALGGTGAIDLANKVKEMCEKDNSHFSYSYDLNDSVEKKINDICTRVYGANKAVLTPKAKESLEVINKLKLDKLPIIIAKTQYSLSDNPKLIGAPIDFDITIRDIEIRGGAEFLVALAGDMMLMPGLNKIPAGVNMKITKSGKISGLF